MSTLSQFSGGGVKQIKTGFIGDAAPSAAAGATSSEDYYYYDVTLTGDPVSDITKCVVVFDGIGHYSGRAPTINNNVSASSVYTTRLVTARLENTTTLRLCHQYDNLYPSTPAYFYTTGRWTIIEYR